MSNRASHKKPAEQRNTVRLLKAIDVLYARGYQYLEVRTPCQVPATGPAILVCNHTTGLDPFLLQSTCRRVVVWMMVREYYQLPGLHWIFKQVEAIPVARNGQDLSATRQAMRALHDGRVLGIFPEGTWEKTHELLPFQTGVAMLAIKTKTKIYPAFIDGSQRNKEMLPAFLMRHNITMRFGPAIDLGKRATSKDSLEAATNEIQSAVESLRQDSLREAPSRRG